MRRIGYPNLERSGRIGNQCWQVASTIGFARAAGVDPVFPESWSYRRWFSLPDHWYDDKALARSIDAVRLSKLPGIQKHYVQQWSYIADVMDEVRAVLHPSPEGLALVDDLATARLPDFTGAVSLHIRRGDNTNPETHPVGTWPTVTMDYYRAAVDLLEPERLFVFSDSPDWCDDHLGGYLGRSFTLVSLGTVRPPDYEPAAYAAAPATDWIDMWLMAQCSGGHIIANSTYSLWGALLGPAPTTYPDNWVGFLCRSAVPDESTICPPDWTMIHNPVAAHELFEDAAPC